MLLFILKLYLIWFDENPIVENETSINGVTGSLGELALRTGGEIIHVPNNSESDGNLVMRHL